MNALFNIFTLLVGSILLGFGVNWMTGLGVFLIGFGWHQTFMGTMTDMYTNTIRNMKLIYDKLPKDKS